MAELAMSKKVNKSLIRVAKDDISLMDVEAFVFYADNDLKLGSGYGGAIAVRGGPKIQEELNGLAPQKTCAAVVSGAGKLKAKHIIHAVGPKFQEAESEDKLAKTVRNALEQAEKLDIEKVAFPPMGAGFYGLALDRSAHITLAAIKKHLEGKSKLKEVMVIVGDRREYGPFSAELETLN
jgi:O-acetyl-ADP-ribose deacetylase (regulator of RNase III)